MKPRTFARRPSSIGSNQLSKSRPSTSSARAVVILLIMAWSPARRSNAGIRVANPGDYATQFQPPPRQHPKQPIGRQPWFLTQRHRSALNHRRSRMLVRRKRKLPGTRAVLDGLFTTVLVLYFLLVSGDIFLRRLLEILPTFSEKRQAVDISQQIGEDISA